MDPFRASLRDAASLPGQEPFRRARVSCSEDGAFAPHDTEDGTDL